MNPYERTAQEMKRQSEGPKRFAKSALGTGSALGAAAFAPMLSRIAPFLSEFIPEDLAIKGLSKINPRIGKFVGEALDGGFDFSEVKNFLGEQINQSQEPTKQDKNIIEQYSPNLNRYLMDIIKNGDTPVAAAAKARKFLDKNQQDIIKKMESDHKVPWEQIVESIFGNGQTAQPSQQPATNSIDSGSNPVVGQQQGGQGQQALMSILQKINQSLGQ